MADKPGFLNFHVDHMTLLLDPKLYNVAYVVFRTIFGVPLDDILYDKRKEWRPGLGEQSMTFAVRIGQGGAPRRELNNTIIAVVQPTEPKDQPSHVRSMLGDHSAAAHWQHIALATPDLMAFHQFAIERGVQFITPILKDEAEDLIQAFTGEWFFPGSKPSGMFFEFLQRNPSADQVRMLAEHNREMWFRDKTFLGLYEEKEKEYQSGKVTPFLKEAVFTALYERVGSKKTWQIDDREIKECEQIMLKYGGTH